MFNIINQIVNYQFARNILQIHSTDGSSCRSVLAHYVCSDFSIYHHDLKLCKSGQIDMDLNMSIISLYLRELKYLLNFINSYITIHALLMRRHELFKIIVLQIRNIENWGIAPCSQR